MQKKKGKEKGRFHLVPKQRKSNPSGKKKKSQLQDIEWATALKCHNPIL
jgi:hypothetical protein